MTAELTAELMAELTVACETDGDGILRVLGLLAWRLSTSMSSY